jgi:hypothetical protein
VVTENLPSRPEARAALAEANIQASSVRRSDHQLAWMLLGIAAVYLATGGVISTLPSLRRGGPVAGLAILTIVIVGVAGLVFVALRIRAYSRAGVVLYFGGVAAFNIWNATVTSVSIFTGWWALTQPSYHFGISELVGAVPLLIAAWLIRRR